MYDAGSAKFCLEQNVTHKVPPAWASVSLIKQKTCHKYHYDNVIMVSYIFKNTAIDNSFVFPDTVNISKRQQSSPFYTDIMSFFFLPFFFAESLLPF